MAALYLHNALFAPEPEPSNRLSPRALPVVPPKLPPNGLPPGAAPPVTPQRAVSSTSTASPPRPTITPPKMHRVYPSTSTMYTEGDGEEMTLGEGQTPLLRPGPRTSDSYTLAERNMYEKSVRRRLRVVGVVKRAGEGVAFTWLLFTLTRYLYSYANMRAQSYEKQTVSLLLGSLSVLGLVLLLVQFILSFYPRIHKVWQIKNMMRMGSVLLFFSVALVDFSYTFVFMARGTLSCAQTLDISVIWSGAGSKCTTGWVALAVVRLIITVLVGMLYWGGAWVWVRVRHPSRAGRSRNKRKHSTPVIEMQEPGGASATGARYADVPSAPNGGPLYVPPPLHSPSQRFFRSPSPPAEVAGFVHRFRALVSEVDAAVDYARRDASPTSTSHASFSSYGQPISPTDSHAHSFATHDDARSYITSNYHSSMSSHYVPNIYGHSEGPRAGDPRSATTFTNVYQDDYHSDRNPYHDPTILASLNLETDYYDPYSPPSNYGSGGPGVHGYDEFGRPHPADEQLPFLGGYVRRMPTIESMSSRPPSSLIMSRPGSLVIGGRSRGNSMGPAELRSITSSPASPTFVHSPVGGSPVSLTSAHGNRQGSGSSGPADEEGRKTSAGTGDQSLSSYYTASTS